MAWSPEKFTITTEEGYYWIRCSGVMGRMEFEKLHEFMVKHVEKNTPKSRCLVDLTQANPQLTNIDRYELANKTSVELRGIKIATLVKKENHTKSLYEDAANNRGVKVMVFDEKVIALKWLLDD